MSAPTVKHVSKTPVKQCRIMTCGGSDRGCGSLDCRSPRWKSWSHNQFVYVFDRCPDGCVAPKDGG